MTGAARIGPGSRPAAPRRGSIDVRGASVELASWGSGPPQIVLLHDGLGSIDQFGDLPADMAQATQMAVMAYNRAGHGASAPVPSSAWPADWLRREADLLADLLSELKVDQPLLVGHSDGGSIALIHAAAHPDSVRGLVVLAAHSFVEDVCVTKIQAMRSDRERWVAGLSRFHPNAPELFVAWSGVWVGREFRPWDIRGDLGAISAPALVVQGRDDEYGTDAMAIGTAAAIGSNGRCVLLNGVGHLLPQEAPDDVIKLVSGLLID